MTAPPALGVAELEVRYYGGPEAAVSDISFSIEAGEGFCVAGGLGGGKSSVVRAVLGLTQYTGEIVLGGERPSPETRRLVAYGPQAADFAAGMTPRQAMELVCGLRGLPTSIAPDCLRQAALDPDRWDLPTGPDSATSRRLSLALASAGPSTLVVLDDPPNDPASEVVVRRAREAGAAVLIAVTDPWPQLLAALGGPVLTLEGGEAE